MVVSLAIPQMESPSSALRYGLLTVKPIPMEEVVRIKGIKYTRRGISFQQDNEKKSEFEKFEDFVNFRYAQIFNKMPIPKEFSQEAIVNHFIDDAVDNAKNDKDFVENLERKDKSLYNFVTFIKERYEKRMPGYFEAEADRFLNSNLPLSFSALSSMFINTYYKYLLLVNRIVRRFEILSNLPGVRNKYRVTSGELASMQKELSPIIDKMDLCCIEYMTLNLYMNLWSAESIEEIDCPKFIDVKKFDSAYFDEFCFTYNNELKSIRKMLFEVSKGYEPELFEVKQESDSTTLMIGKLLTRV